MHFAHYKYLCEIVARHDVSASVAVVYKNGKDSVVAVPEKNVCAYGA